MADGCVRIASAAVLARNLSHVLDVPQDQAEAFLGEGDPKAVRRLKQALQGMPGTEFAAAATDPSGTGPSHSLPQGLRARLQGLNTLKTVYSGDYGGRDVQRQRAASLQALKNLVRQDYAGQLEEWQDAASIRDLAVLADACRSIRSAAPRPATSYGKMCTERGDAAAAAAAARASPNPHLRRRNLRNYSTGVPLGGIYKEPDAEMIKSKSDLTVRVLEAAKDHEEELRTGVPAGMATGPACHALRDLVSSANVAKGCFVHPDRPGNTRSLSQASWHVGVHKKGNAELYGHKSVVIGAKAWQDCKHTVAWTMGVHDWPPPPLGTSQSLPRLQC
mmetsp:Transcript_117984/g.367580  ORF Transcript_117984/g.367580 Transcript_117984/m.367580 type:complete len:333 (+) Transcript_117984:72-1070(+)